MGKGKILVQNGEAGLASGYETVEAGTEFDKRSYMIKIQRIVEQ